MKKNYLILLLTMLVIVGCKDVKPTVEKRTIVRDHGPIVKELSIMDAEYNVPMDRAVRQNERMVVGGACSYEDYTKEVIMVSIDEVEKINGCEVSINLKYKIIEENGQTYFATKKYPISKAYAIAEGFDVGTKHTLAVSSITSGTCTPYIDELKGIDVSKFTKECHK